MRRARRFLGVLWACASVLCASCTGDTALLKEGYYSAQCAEFDDHGWKEYVSLRVSGGRIVVVEYNAFNASGFIKSWDMSYMRVMSVTDGTYPNAYTRYYAGQLLKKQNIDGIDVLSGSTVSYNSFLRLAGAALENARNGIAETSMVNVR